MTESGLRVIDPPFVASGPCGVAVRGRLKGLTAEDERVLRLVGGHLGSLERERADFEAGVVRVVRGGKRLARNRHHLDDAQLTEGEWRARGESERWFLHADGESGERYGNETIRIAPEGQVSIKLPAPPADLANAPHGRYVLAAGIRFAHRGTEWADRVQTNRAVAYRIRLDVARGRWYITASWQVPKAPRPDRGRPRRGGDRGGHQR